MTSIHDRKTWYAYQVQVAQEWRTKHNLPKVSNKTAVKLYWTIPGQSEAKSK